MEKHICFICCYTGHHAHAENFQCVKRAEMVFYEIVLWERCALALRLAPVLLPGKGGSAVNATDFIQRANVGNSLRVFQN